ncbi:MAG: hypothetical protein H0V40_05980 [Actinobacteria bacterium]|nr:hypothetical protein [Actinomycetota bacterium]
MAGRAEHEDIARLLEEATLREAERARLSEQLITAEQDERRRLADHLHDTAVQSLSGIALMLDAALHSLEAGKPDEARTVVTAALERQRATIRSLRDLSFNLEPVVLRDHGFVPAVEGLAEHLSLEHGLRIHLELGAVGSLAGKAQVALYQILREALEGAIRRGPPSSMSVTIAPAEDGGIEVIVADDARGERRRASYEAIVERARALNGRVTVRGGSGEGGTTVVVSLPSYAAQG